MDEAGTTRPSEPSAHEITRMLERIRNRDDAAARQLVDLVYDELRDLARDSFRGRAPGETLQPTSLVHETYLRIFRQAEVDFENREHFFAVAAKAMRQILADHARRRRAAKRGRGWNKITLSEVVDPARPSEVDLVALDRALEELSVMDERKGQVVQLRLLGGMKIDEISRVLSPRPQARQRPRGRDDRGRSAEGPRLRRGPCPRLRPPHDAAHRRRSARRHGQIHEPRAGARRSGGHRYPQRRVRDRRPAVRAC